MRSARLLVFAGAICAVIGCASMGLRLGDGGARPAWELPPPAVLEAPVVTPGALNRTVLENGMRVLVLEDRRLPRAVIGIAFRRGEASVPPERAGLTAFMAELMKRGAGDRDALALAEYVDEIGASLGVSAGWDSLSVDVTGLSRDLDRLFEILSDVALSPRFEKAEADRARDEQLASIERSKDDPATLAGWYMAQAVYPGHRFGSPLEGTPETVAQFDEAAARALHAQLVIPNDAILYASGDVSIDDIAARARRAFAAWQPGEILDPGAAPPVHAPAARKILIVNRPDLVQARIAVSHEGIARTDDDRIPTAIMNSVLGGGGFSSRLFSRLRADEGLTYSVYSAYSLRRSPGPFRVSTFTRVPEVRRALDLVFEEIARMRTEPPSVEELTWARTLAVGHFSMGLETSAAVMNALVNLDVYGLPEDSLDTYRARVRAADDETVARAALDHLHPDRAAIVLVGPAEQLVPQVEDLGPIEIVEP